MANVGFGSGDAGRQAGVARAMPPGMKVVVSIVFILLALFFAFRIVDIAYGETMILSARAKTDAAVTAKSVSHGRSGYTYHIAYSFTVADQAYGRRLAFGLVPFSTKVGKAAYDSLSIGDGYPILYSNSDPRLNRPEDERPSLNRLLLYLLGMGLFGFMSFNELRSMGKK